MKTNLDHKINEEKLKKLKTIFSVHEASKIGLTRLSLKRLTDKGTLLRLENGIYRKHSKSWDVSLDDFACACLRFGKESYIGGLTALAYHQLLNFSPRAIWVVTPSVKRSTKHRLIRMTKKIPHDGVETISGVVKMAGVDRSLVDAFWFAHKVTLQHAFFAARRAFADQKTSPEKLLSLARTLGLENYILKHWEALQFE
jgi:predicted transcriptional regulator of viral defense system